MKPVKWLALILLLMWTWAIRVYHIGVLVPPLPQVTHATAQWISKSEIGINQLLLTGDAYGRGLRAGELTRHLLRLQEQELSAQLFSMIPEWLFKILEVPLIRYFWGIEKHLDPWMLDEMYGIAQSAPKEFERLIDSYTRQLAYHGLHEVGQMMVDQGGEDMGCTVVAAPVAGHDWVLGRNFDFEGSRTLDREKIMKWVFPDSGLAYVSVIWAGMVGGVTGVNERGLYLSLNAAGSEDHRRMGMPTSLLMVKVLMFAHNAAEAIHLLESENTFITDIFVLLDSQSGELYRIEKSPRATEVMRLRQASAVTNHLQSPRFAHDKVNQMRKVQLTTEARSQRAQERLRAPEIYNAKTARELELPVLKILRDKGPQLGNRRAIDPLIATHSVVFNSAERILFVGQGPALTGAFLGFDLSASFARRKPVLVRALPRDQVSEETFAQLHASRKLVTLAEHQLKPGHCTHARELIAQITWRESVAYYQLLGDVAATCDQDVTLAVKHWQQALAMVPAYRKEEEALRVRLEGKL